MGCGLGNGGGADGIDVFVGWRRGGGEQLIGGAVRRDKDTEKDEVTVIICLVFLHSLLRLQACSPD